MRFGCRTGPHLQPIGIINRTVIVANVHGLSSSPGNSIPSIALVLTFNQVLPFPYCSTVSWAR